MNKSLKFSLVSLIFLLSIFGIIGIQGTPENTTQSAELVFWSYESGKHFDFLTNEITDFESANSGTSVTIVQKDPENMLLDIYTAFANDNGPDVFQIQDTWISQLSSRGIAMNLDSDFTSEFESKYLPHALRAMKGFDLSGNVHYYGYPLYVDTVLFIYNSEIYSDAQVSLPQVDELWTWTEWLEAVATASDISDPSNQVYGLGTLSFPESIEPIFYGMGAELISNFVPDDEHYVGNSDLAEYAINFTKNLYSEYKLFQPIGDFFSDTTKTGFMEDETITGLFASFRNLPEILSSTAFSDESNLGVTQIPNTESVGKGAPLDFSGLAISNELSGDKLTKSKALALYLSQDSSENALNDYLYFPANFGDLSITEDDIIKAYKFGIGRAYQSPISKEMLEVRNIYGNILKNFIEGKIVTLDTAMTSLTNTIQTELPEIFEFDVISRASIPDELTITGDPAQQVIDQVQGSGVSGFGLFGIFSFVLIVFVVKKRKNN